MKTIRLILLFLLIPFSSFSSDFKFSDVVTEDKLENGLKIYIIDNQINPQLIKVTVVVNIGYEQGKPGLAHFLEHCLLLGSQNYSKKQLSEITKKRGSISNAITSANQTCYFYEGLANDLELFLSVLSDQVQNPLFPKEFVDAEKKPVTDESCKSVGCDMDKYKNEVFKILMPNVNGCQAQYGTGTPEDIEKLTIEDLKDFWKKYYVSNNMAIIVESALPAEKVKDTIKTYFENLRMDKNFIHPKIKKIPSFPNKATRLKFESESFTTPSIVQYFPVTFSKKYTEDELAQRFKKLTEFIDLSPKYGFLSLKEVEHKAASICCKFINMDGYYYFEISASPISNTPERLASLEKLILETHQKISNLEVPEKKMRQLNKLYENNNMLRSDGFGYLTDICSGAFEDGKPTRTIDEINLDYFKLTSKDLFETYQAISQEPILTAQYLPKSVRE